MLTIFPPAPRAIMRRSNGLRQLDNSVQICLKQMVVFLFGVLLERFADVGAGDVDQDVDGFERVERGGDRVRIGQVQLKRRGVLALLAQARACSSSLSMDRAGKHGASAGFGKPVRDSESDAAARAGDQGGLAFQHCVPKLL